MQFQFSSFSLFLITVAQVRRHFPVSQTKFPNLFLDVLNCLDFQISVDSD